MPRDRPSTQPGTRSEPSIIERPPKSGAALPFAKRYARTPLFRDGGSALTVTAVRDTVKALMGALGLDRARYGAHSLRIGGASAGLAAGLSAAALRAAGRWSSDIYTLYTRASKEAVQGMATVIGSTPYHDLERGEFVDEELTVTTSDLAGAGAGEGLAHVEQDLIDDALADEDYED